jgi:hypothetical protein
MFRFAVEDRLVRAIRDGATEMRRRYVKLGSYDGHDLINWMNDNRNDELNDIIGYYRPGADPVHAATIQIGNFLKNCLGQTKIGEQESPRRITLRGGGNRDVCCNVSVWQIP